MDCALFAAKSGRYCPITRVISCCPTGVAEMRSMPKVIASVLVSTALVASSTAATAAAPAPAAPVAATQTQAPSAWLMLSAMSSTRAIALGGANAAAQPANAPPPPPPPPPAYVSGAPHFGGELIAVLVWFALIAVALSAGDGGPNSPP